MVLRLQHLVYRIAAPLAHVWWGLSGAEHDGVKCLIINGGEVVLVRHTYGDRRRWDFPGGFVRRGEAPEAAAGREMEEELGVGAGGGLRHLGVIVHRAGRRRGTVHYYGLERADRALDPDPGELAEVGWFAPGELPRPLGDHVGQALAWIGPAAAGGVGRARPPLR